MNDDIVVLFDNGLYVYFSYLSFSPRIRFAGVQMGFREECHNFLTDCIMGALIEPVLSPGTWAGPGSSATFDS